MKKLTLILTLFLTSVIGIFAQTTPTPIDKGENDVVKISTTLIQVDVSVTDKSGKQITDLKPEDFEVLENGKPQTITNFSYIKVTPETRNEAQTSAPVQTNSKTKPGVVPPVLTNLRPDQIHRTIALVVDDLALSTSTINGVRSALKKFVDEQLQPGDLVAIIRTGSGAGFLQQFTSDKRILYAAIERVRWNPAGNGRVNVFQPVDPSDSGATGAAIADISGGLSPDVDQNIDQVNAQQSESQSQGKSLRGQISDYNEDIFAVGTLGAVNYVIKGMSKLPGRKAVVLFSEGFKLYSQDSYDTKNNIKGSNPRLMEAFQRLTEMANRSSVIIYTMDARGVTNSLMAGAEDNFDNLNTLAGNSNEANKIEGEAINRSTELYETQQGLRSLAEQTGGFAIINNNNLSKGLSRVLDDQSGYYLLGYQPDEETFDAKKSRFNKLTIRLKRPDVRLRYRSGFFNVKDEDTIPQTRTPRQQILDALSSPFSTNDIDLRLTSLFANDAKTGPFMRSLIYVSGKGLQFTEDADGWQKATFDVEIMIFGDNGTVIDEISQTQNIKAKADTLQEIRDKGFVATVTVPIKKAGAYQMRIVLRDSKTAQIGSANQFIEVPNLKKNQLALSGIVLSRYNSKNNVEMISKKQFQSDEDRDNAVRRFHLGDTVKFDMSIYNAKPNKGANPNLALQYKIYRDGKEIFSLPEKVLNTGQADDLQSIERSEVFNLGKKMPLGEYVLQVVVRDAQSQSKKRIAVQWTDFEIVQ